MVKKCKNMSVILPTQNNQYTYYNSNISFRWYRLICCSTLGLVFISVCIAMMRGHTSHQVPEPRYHSTYTGYQQEKEPEAPWMTSSSSSSTGNWSNWSGNHRYQPSPVSIQSACGHQLLSTLVTIENIVGPLNETTSWLPFPPKSKV